MMKNIKIIAYLFCCCVCNFCLGQQITTQELNIKKGLKFNKNSQFGINKKGTGTIQVDVFDSLEYEDNHAAPDSSFMYGFTATGNTSPNYNNTNYTYEKVDVWWCAKHFFLWCDSDYNRTLNSNDLKFFKKAVNNRNTQFSYDGQGDWHIMGETKTDMDVTIKLTLSDGATLNDIISIKIPGVKELTKEDFEGTEPLYSIEVYRGNTTPEHTYYPNDDIVVFEGDSVVFKSNVAFDRLEGLTDLAIQRYAGESLFMSNAVKQGAHKPFLFYDSNVHGVKMRSYPESWANGNHKYPTFSENQGEYTISWIANSRRDHLYNNSTGNNNVSLSAYKLKDDFDLAEGFPNKNKFTGDLGVLPEQRNNQKEGLNVEILKAYEEGKKGVAGLDPDELIYKNFAQSKISGENIPSNTNFTYVTGDEWKKIEPNHPGDINYSLQQSINKIGEFIDPNEYYDFELTEIMDKNLYIHKNSTESIDNKTFDYSTEQNMFNHKRPIVYSPSANNKPVFHNSSELELIHPNNDYNETIKIAVLSPLEGEKHGVVYNQLTEDHRKDPKINFYGIINGPSFVARHQTNVIYSVNNLPHINAVPGKFELVYTHEDNNGFITTKRKQVYYENNDFIIDKFSGGGYHEITLQYTRNKTKGTPVIIAGKELIDVDLRFIFAPNENNSKDFSHNPTEIFKANNVGKFKGKVRLSEQKGNGNRWFLSSQSDQLKDDYGLNYGYEDHNVVRTYTLSEQESVTLSVLDADPHSFTHYEPDWYLSERRLSKRITDNELKNVGGDSYIKWYKADNLEFNNAIQISTGKHCLFGQQQTYGTYYVKAEFNETSKIIVKIKVRNTNNNVDQIISTAGQNLGVVNYYPLNDNQFEVLKSIKGDHMGSTTKDDYKILAIQDILSTYTYGAHDLTTSINTKTGPRFKVDGVEVGEHKRFSPQNNFDARFDWTIKDEFGANLNKNHFLFYHFDSEKDPNLEKWFPKNWIRHLDNVPQSPEIPSFVNTDKIHAFNTEDDPKIEDLNNNDSSLYEPWQVRLPWIAQKGVHGYKTRWNIKTVYDINKMFDLNYIGTAYKAPGVTAHDYHIEVNGIDGSKIIPGFDGVMREKQEFFHHLKAGRMVILRIHQFENEPSKIQVIVTNNPKNTTPLGTEVYDGTVTLNTNTNQSRTALNTDKMALDNDIHVYPNPSKSGVFNIRISTKESSLVTLELFDVLGKSIYKEQLSNQIGARTIKIGEGLQLKTGVYILQVNSNGKTTNKKLIIK
jgi:hypothetical protein